MRKKIVAFLLILSLALCCSCSNEQAQAEDTTTVVDTTVYESPHPFPEVEPMTDELRESIESAIDESNGFESDHTWASPYTPRGILRYYGAYGEIFVVFCKSDMQEESFEKIGGEVFRHSTSFSLLAYYDGKLIQLKEAYEQGFISAQEVAEIAKIHLQFDMWQFPQLYD